MIKERLFRDFAEMARIPSPTYHEKEINAYLVERLKGLGARVEYDPEEGASLQSNAGNIYAYFPGDPVRKPILLSAHTDTVTPAGAFEAHLENGKITGDGRFVLGADDKAAIAVIFEVLRRVKEMKCSHPPIEIAFSVAEETGLEGAALMDLGRFRSGQALVLDMSGMDLIGYAAVGSLDIQLTFKGKAAHAGWAIDEGINSVMAAASFLQKIKTGTLDSETVLNIGRISGGEAVNIVPEETRLSAELRSFREEKMKKAVEELRTAAQKTEAEYPGLKIRFDVREKYKPYENRKEIPLIKALQKAGKKIGRPQKLVRCKGGSDANIFNNKGLESVVLSIGMTDVHSVREWILLDDMAKVVQLVLAFLKEWK